MAKAKTNYTKTAVLQMFRKWADADSTWQHHVDKLKQVQCQGDLKPLPPGAPPDAPRRAAEGTSLDKVGLRHAMRDICRCVAMLDETSNNVLNKAWLDRQRAQAERDEYAGANGGWGKYHRLRQDIEKIESASTRVAKIEIVEREKRRLIAVADEASRKFALIEDRRFFVDEVRKKYVGSFPEIHDWVPPTGRPETDTRSMVQAALDEIDFSSVGLDGEVAFFLEHVSGRWIGHTQHGPMIFAREEPALQYVDSKMGLSVKAEPLTEDNVREILRWYNDHHRFVIEKPKDASWLFERFPELLCARPTDDSEMTEALEYAGKTEGGW